MRMISTTTRIAIGLSSITLSVVLTAGVLGLIPDRNRAVMEGRSRLCEATAISFTLLTQQDDYELIRFGLEAIVNRNPEMRSAAVRKTAGDLIARVGNHEQMWNDLETKDLPGTQMFVPIMFNGEPWGSLEFCFEPIQFSGWLSLWKSTEFRLPLFMTIASWLGSLFYLKRVLRQLDPSKVVPGRVRQALDTLTEGLLLLDKSERIVLANRAFTETSGVPEKQLLGRKASTLSWRAAHGEELAQDLPWQKVLRGEEAEAGTMLRFMSKSDETRTFMVNSAPILDEYGHSQGALTSFGDVTTLEKKKSELAATLSKLQHSAEEIRRQNQELERLATEDPLTGCLNRRSFFESFETSWGTAIRTGQPLSCVMADIDFFKSINDRFGHSKGDEVLRLFAATLKQAARDTDVVCRYGGEEFCILMPDTDIQAAEQAAERLRLAIANFKHPQLSVTASFGVSSRSLLASNPQELLDQADKCLYVAKQNGRNCVVRFDRVSSEILVKQFQPSHTRVAPSKASAPAVVSQPIPFHAVIALMSALAYRDLTTAEHSRRVADLCVRIGEGLMSPSQCYVLEIAALLHDIGKIGVPDSILLKSGPLTVEERETMRTHQHNGIALVRASFKSPELCSILECRALPPHATWVDPLIGEQSRIPVGARILAIADSFDSMVSHRAYRKALSHTEAFAELRRCAGSQFDAELVERFIARSLNSNSTTSVANAASKETALSIGLHVEQLVSALDRQDFETIKDLASHMQLVATKQGASQIALQAADLQATLNADDADLLAILHEADSLLKLCRDTQQAYFDDIRVTPNLATRSVSGNEVLKTR